MSYERISYERWVQTADATPESMIKALERMPPDVPVVSVEIIEGDITYVNRHPKMRARITAELRAS